MKAKLVYLVSFLIFFSLFNLAGHVLAEEEVAGESASSFKENPQVSLELITDRESFQPGNTINDPVGLVGIKFKIKPEWHIYWINSGESAFPTQINWNVPDNWEAGFLNWSQPTKYIEKGGIKTFGYEDEVLLFSEVFADFSGLDEEHTVEVGAEINYLVCKDICVPGRASLKKEILVSSTQPLAPTAYAELFDKTKRALAAKTPESLEFSFDKSFYKPGETANLLIDFKSSADITSDYITENVQVFPFKSDVLTGIDTYSVKGDTFRLALPITVSNDAPSGQANYGGTALLSDELAKKLGISRYFSWETPLQVKVESLTEAFKNENFPDLASISKNAISFNTTQKEKSADKASEANQINEAGSEASKANLKQNRSIFYYMLLAFLGGLLLNLMPCVLPVVSIKIFSLVEHQHMSKSERLKSALFTMLGILSSFLALAIAVIVVRNLGTHVGWGFQFQSPVFLFCLIISVFVFALSFLGFFNINLNFSKLNQMQSGGEEGPKEKTNIVEDFLDGVLVTTLSTPCTAPLLGTALAFAFLAPSYAIILIFLLIGLGLSLPYTLLSLSSSLHKYFPQPGAWMNSFKQLMGFLLLGTVVWLLTVYGHLTSEGLSKSLWLLLFLGFSFWLQKQSFLNAALKKFWPILALVIFLSLVYSWKGELFSYSKSAASSASSSKLIAWTPYSEDVLKEASDNSQAVFIDFTAEWCVTCKANEKLIIYTDKVVSALKEHNIKPVIADWTKKDEEISNALKKYGGSGVPYYVVLGKDGEVSQILNSILTKESLVGAFRKANGG